MIVKYVRERGYQGRGNDPLFTLNKDYIVLGYSIKQHDFLCEIDVVCDRENSPTMLDFQYCEVVDSSLPAHWIIKKNEYSFFTCPPEFIDDFPEKYEDNDPEAIKTFRRVVNETYAFHGLDPLFKDPAPQAVDYTADDWWKEYVTDEPLSITSAQPAFSPSSLGIDTINRILLNSSPLKSSYYDRLDHHTQCQIEKGTLNQKWQSLRESLFHYIQGNAVDPNIIIDVLHQIETYFVQQENKARHAEVKEEFFWPLIQWMQQLKSDDTSYSSARLIMRNLGPFCEQYVTEIDPQIRDTVLNG